MIFDLLYSIGGSLVAAFAAALSRLSFVFPSQIMGIFSYAFQYLNYFGGVIDLPVFYIVLLSAIAFEIFWFGFLLVWWVIGFFRSLITRSSHSGA